MIWSTSSCTYPIVQWYICLIVCVCGNTIFLTNQNIFKKKIKFQTDHIFAKVISQKKKKKTTPESWIDVDDENLNVIAINFICP